ncbi:MAG: hypothetical protein J5620_04195 [Alphaproteobacteria bacterium]|nr:hypothetical protein [Alphaproteobacteria bacterium]
MREGIKTSLISILCVAFASVANAAPTVRVVGGAGTYDSAASATAARAGSLRATGGYVRPTASVSGTAANAVATPTTSATTAGGAVSTGGTTVGRVASSPRLSIGKYIGAPKSVSTSGGGTGSDLTGRVEQLETDVSALQTDKQDTLTDSTYITIQGDQVILDLERVREDLEIGTGTDGREVEMGTNDDGLLWRYVGDTEWQTLITWDEISQKLDFDGIEQTLTTNITNLRNEMLAALETKVDKDQGTDNAGMAMVVGDDGILAPTGDFVSRDQGIANAGSVLVVDDNGFIVPSDGEMITSDDLGDLAYEDTVSTPFIDDGAVERSKLATDITNTLDQVTAWETWWNENKPGDGDYVMSVQSDGTRQWFRVITADEATGGNSGGTGGEEPTEL